MGWLSSLFSSSTVQPIEAVGNALDKLFTSDDERAQAEAVMAKLRMHPAELQVELNKIEAQHRSIFVSGWRPFIGWVCGLGLAFSFIINPIIQWASGSPGPDLPAEIMTELVFAMLGLGALRTAEKFGGKSK